LTLVQSTAVAADGVAVKLTSPSSVADTIAKRSPLRDASLNADAGKMRRGTAAERARAQVAYVDDRPWVERHPAWTGAIVGFGAGFGLDRKSVGKGKGGMG
jgi:hypothetical protein